MTTWHCKIGIALALAGSVAVAPAAVQVATPLVATSASWCDERAIAEVFPIGRVHEAMQRSLRRVPTAQWLKDEYGDYLAWKASVLKQTGFR